jgi:hypothetical protein
MCAWPYGNAVFAYSTHGSLVLLSLFWKLLWPSCSSLCLYHDSSCHSDPHGTIRVRVFVGMTSRKGKGTEELLQNDANCSVCQFCCHIVPNPRECAKSCCHIMSNPRECAKSCCHIMPNPRECAKSCCHTVPNPRECAESCCHIVPNPRECAKSCCHLMRNPRECAKSCYDIMSNPRECAKSCYDIMSNPRECAKSCCRIVPNPRECAKSCCRIVPNSGECAQPCFHMMPDRAVAFAHEYSFLLRDYGKHVFSVTQSRQDILFKEVSYVFSGTSGIDSNRYRQRRHSFPPSDWTP